MNLLVAKIGITFVLIFILITPVGMILNEQEGKLKKTGEIILNSSLIILSTTSILLIIYALISIWR